MNGDVKAAAERLRRMRAESDANDGGYPATPEGRRQSLSDHATLADAWLAEHPADDDELADSDWLMSIGFVENWYGALCCERKISDASGDLSLTQLNDYWRIERHSDGQVIHIAATLARWQVRMLCRALGIPLKESE